MHRAAAGSLALAFALLTGAGISNAAASTCSTDTFTIDGSAVTVQLCLATSSKALDETFATKGQPPLSRTLPLDAAPTDEPSRTIDDVSLQKLGLARTLHLTIELRTSGVRLEHALLVPGAIALK